MLSGNFAEMPTSTPFRDLLHAVNLRHGTDGFTSPPKEGVLRIFSPLKIRRHRPGLNPRTWVLKASTLPLDHRSHIYGVSKKNVFYRLLLSKLHFNSIQSNSIFMSSKAPNMSVALSEVYGRSKGKIFENKMLACKHVT